MRLRFFRHLTARWVISALGMLALSVAVQALATPVRINFQGALVSDDPNLFLSTEVECNGICVYPISTIRFETYRPQFPEEGPTGSVLTIDEYHDLVGEPQGSGAATTAHRDEDGGRALLAALEEIDPLSREKLRGRFGDVFAHDPWGQVIVNTIEPAIAVWISLELLRGAATGVGASIRFDPPLFDRTEEYFSLLQADAAGMPPGTLFTSVPGIFEEVSSPGLDLTEIEGTLASGSRGPIASDRIFGIGSGAGGTSFYSDPQKLAVLNVVFLDVPEMPVAWLLGLALSAVRLAGTRLFSMTSTCTSSARRRLPRSVGDLRRSS